MEASCKLRYVYEHSDAYCDYNSKSGCFWMLNMGETYHMKDKSLYSHAQRRKAAIGEGEIYVVDTKRKKRMLYNDFLGLQKDVPLILWRAWSDTKARYKRSILGPYWLSIGTLTFVVGYSILAGLLFQRPLEEFLGYIACGVITWQLISGTLIEGSKIFVSNAHEIKSVRVNLMGLPLKQTLRGLISLMHSLPIVMIVVYFTDAITWHTLMFIPGLVILCITLTGLTLALGTLAARLRDIEQLTMMLIQFMFYMSPILWKTEMLGTGIGRWLAWGNPFYYLLTIIRQPLMGQAVPWDVWAVSIGVMTLSLLTGLVVYTRFRQRIPFWV